MKVNQYIRYAVQLILVLMAFSCAQVVAPTGGAKDEIPPTMVSVDPPNESINLNPEEIEIEFDEFVKLNRLKDELIVSPPLKHRLETSIKGKKLKIGIVDTLKENATYVLNFGNAIVDITENNPISNFLYVFSTGEDLDTLSIQGQVSDAFDNVFQKEVLVMLYDAFEDSLPLKEMPNYIARTNESGGFYIGNIKAGEYKVFALKDENSNYLFDRADEQIAFDTNRIQISLMNESLDLSLFKEDREKQFVKTQKEEGSVATFLFNRPFDSLSIQLLDTNLEDLLIQKEIGINKDSVSLWFRSAPESDYKIVFSTDTSFRDTMGLKLDVLEKKLNIDFPLQAHFYEPYVLHTNFPMDSICLDSLQWLGPDSVALDYEIRQSDNKRRIIFDFERLEGEQYSFQALPGAFLDIYGRKNDSLNREVSMSTSKEYGNLKVRLEHRVSGPQIMQLLDAKSRVIQEAKVEGQEVNFQNLPGGQYGLKLILDANDNGKWDTGNYLEKIAPERTILFNEVVTIRANWDKDLNWQIK